MRGRNGFVLSIQNVPSNKNARCTSFRLGYSTMKMASLATHLSILTTLVVVCAAVVIWLCTQWIFNPTAILTLFVFILLVIAMFQLRATVVEESLLINYDLGVQIETIRLDGKTSYTFLDKETIKAFVFNEGIHLCQVEYYLGFIVRDQEDLVLCFRNFPGVDILQKVYRRGTETLSLG
jgi:hypothetical protein|tara:strand:- start:89 stop:625 length:537 start_codon:yes stop_codon:yes gene_type:complete